MADTESQKAQDFSAFYQKYAASIHRYVYTRIRSHELQYSLRETACAMGITLANVKVLQFRALKRAASLGGDGPRQ
jgi:hypothetical protein